MRAALGLVGLLAALLTGYMIFSYQVRQKEEERPLMQQADSVAVRGDLLSLGQAERLYYAANGRYATLEELRLSNVMNSVPTTGRSGYRYSIEVDGDAHFQITASPRDSSSTDLPTLSIDETLQISQ